MQLINIDKTLYRKRLNIVIASFIVTLTILALAFAQLFILNFAQEGVSNFKYNLLGVFLALLACAAILHSIKEHEFFKEIYYVWRLKQLQNKIFRKLVNIQRSAKEGKESALIILLFYYQSLKLVYLLDDNTLTIAKVEKDLNEVNKTINSKNIVLSVEQFDKSLLASYA
ncbi:MAG: DUF3087 family protein [Litorilituus sp.]|jgi:hypothetical protein|nr:DUF3087 family protein [Litorilituus sp.]